MRYRRIEEVEFINKYGVKKKIYGVRPVETYTSGLVNETKEYNRELDDLAAKIWGSGYEIMSYVLREQNVEQLLINDFNEKRISKVVVPSRLS